MSLLIALILLLALLVGGAFALSAYESNHARALEAEVALTAQHSAASANTTLIVVFALVIFALLAVMVAYLYFNRPRRRASALRRAHPLAASGRESLALDGEAGAAALLDRLVQLQVLALLRNLQEPQRQLEDAWRDTGGWR